MGSFFIYKNTLTLLRQIHNMVRINHIMFHVDQTLADLLWQNSVIGLAKVGLDGRWLCVNRTLCSILEYTESELEKLTFQNITHPEDIDDDLEMIKRVIDKSIPSYIMAKRYITKSNRIIWMKLRIDPIVDNSGQVGAFLSQIAPAMTLDSGTTQAVATEYVTKHGSLSEFSKHNLKWVVTFIGGICMVLVGMYRNNTEVGELGKIVILGALAGQTLDRDIKKNVKS